MEKRVLIAIILSLIVIILYPRISPAPTPQPGQDDVKHNRKMLEESKPAYHLPAPATISQTGNHQHSMPSAKETEATLESGELMLTFSSKGGSIKRIESLEYETVLADDMKFDERLLGIRMPNSTYDLLSAPFSSEKIENTLIYSYVEPNGLFKVAKKYTLDIGTDEVYVEIELENTSDIPYNIKYDITGPAKIIPVSKGRGRNYRQISYKLDGKIYNKSGIGNSQENLMGVLSWVAFKNRYFAIAVRPGNEIDGGFIKKNEKKELITGLRGKARIIRPGQLFSDSYRIYIGPIDKKRIARFDSDLQGLVYSGFLGIGTMLIGLLGFINGIVGNWGVSIILATVVINIALLPLTIKSFSSMQKMQQLQPHMEELRRVHKDNPQKLNKEVMELYKKYNVNPFGGCLPMFIQIPFFFGFYQTLMRSIELRNAGFLWIKDLSSPDALFKFGDSIPLLGDTFNLLPIITVILMVLQQRITTMRQGSSANSEMRKQQQMMGMVILIPLSIFLWGAPAGLVLYWLTNSMLMTSEHFVLLKRSSVSGG